jgi:hypothetical protein
MRSLNESRGKVTPEEGANLLAALNSGRDGTTLRPLPAARHRVRITDCSAGDKGERTIPDGLVTRPKLGRGSCPSSDGKYNEIMAAFTAAQAANADIEDYESGEQRDLGRVAAPLDAGRLLARAWRTAVLVRSKPAAPCRPSRRWR